MQALHSVLMGVRVDKWLQVARAFRTRSKATRACTLGRVRINGNTCKPHRSLKLGDQIEIDIGDWTRVLIVSELRDRPLPKAQAARVYEDLSPPRPVLDVWGRLLRRTPAQRQPGAGRPTKRDRRDIDRWRQR